jgi:alpha-tubulin suppressor-like RCC1 family protein
VSAPLAGGTQNTLVVLPDGSVWSWGLLPAPVSGVAGIETAVAGDSHNVALSNDGLLFVWGQNNRGQLGIGNPPAFSITPTPGPNFDDDVVVAIAAGDDHTLALTRNGSLYAWGWDTNGQLGNGSGGPIQSNLPVLVDLDEVIAIAVGGDHSLAVTADLRVWAWGPMAAPSSATEPRSTAMSPS